MAGRRRSVLALCLLTSCIVPTISASGSETVDYIYDARGRLLKVSRSGTVNNGVRASYCYDKADNRTNVTVATAGGGGSTPAFSVNSASATEGGAIIFTVTKCPTASGTLTVDYATSSGSATSGADFTATSGTLSFLADETGKTITVPTTDDASAESGETLTVALSNASAGSVIGTATGTGTIYDNDSVETPPSFAVGDSMGTEGGSLFFTVTKTGTVAQTYSVTFQTINNSATSGSDYTARVGTLAFTATETSKTVAIDTIDDTIVESAETLYVGLTVPTGGATITDNLGAGTINDNDVAPTCGGISFTIASSGTVTEGTSPIFTVTKTGSTSNSCSVNYATADGTATAISDYTAASGMMTFNSADTSKTVSVTTSDDTAVESPETFTMSLSLPTGGSTLGAPSSATATVNDNDAAAPSFAINDVTVAEGDNLVLTVTKTGSTSSSFSVNFATANGTATAGSDYTATSGTLSFSAAVTTQTITVASTNDVAVEDPETVLVNLSGATGGATITDAQGVGTINSDDVPPPPSFAINDVSVAEGGNLVLTVTKTGSTSSSFSVDYATSGGTATAGSDYTATSGTLTFTSAETAKTITITTVNDTTVENNETVNVNLSGATGGATITDTQGIGTIISDDVGFSINDGSATEGTAVGFIVSKAGTTSSTTSVNYATANGTATLLDYYSKSGTLTFLANETSKFISVNTKADEPLENSETFKVNLSGASGATITDSQGIGTIIDEGNGFMSQPAGGESEAAPAESEPAPDGESEAAPAEGEPAPGEVQ